MSKLTRIANEKDKIAIYKIWKSVFGDTEANISDFFVSFDNKCTTVVVDVSGEPVAAGHIIPAGNLVLDDAKYKCAMIYAIATLHEHRGLGYASLVTNTLISEGLSAGNDVVILCPSNDLLFDFYSDHTDMHEFFYINERTINVISHVEIPPTLTEISFIEYNTIRELFLVHIPHIETGMETMSYQNRICNVSGGALYRVNGMNGNGCAIIEKREDGSIIISELLLNNISEDAAISSIAIAYPSESYTIRTPARSNEVNEKTRRFGMISPSVSSNRMIANEQYSPYYGPAFD